MRQSVKTMPKDTGIVLWKTIAPVMLPRASVSLERRTQSTLLNFSGSSVARGTTISERIRGVRPIDVATSDTYCTKMYAAPIMSARPATICTITIVKARVGVLTGKVEG